MKMTAQIAQTKSDSSFWDTVKKYAKADGKGAIVGAIGGAITGGGALIGAVGNGVAGAVGKSIEEALDSLDGENTDPEGEGN